MRDNHSEPKGNWGTVTVVGTGFPVTSCLPHDLHLPSEGTKLARVKGGSLNNLGLKEPLKAI